MYADLEDGESAAEPPPSIDTTTSSEETDKVLASVTIHSLPSLPLRRLPVLTGRWTDPAVAAVNACAPEVSFRALRRDEISSFYEAARAAADDPMSIGSYGVDELLDLAYFARWYVDGHYVTVIELEATGQTVGYMSFCPSSFSRSSQPIINDANLVILPEFRRNKWAPYLLAVNAVMSKEAGFRGTQGEAAVTNLASVMSMIRNGCLTNGCLPRAIYFRETGWTDIVMTYLDLDHIPVPTLADLKTMTESKL
jgi:hypothetical protein